MTARIEKAIVVEQAGELRFDLAPGVWRIKAEAAGFWPEEVVRSLSTDTRLTLALRATGRVAAETSFAVGAVPPQEIVLGFRDKVRPGTTSPSSAGLARCGLKGKRLSCELPSGDLQLRFEAAGSMPLYLWDVAVGADETHDMGRLDFERGASIVGFVAREDERQIGSRCRAELISLDGSRITRSDPTLPGPALRGAARVEVGASVNEHGFFQIRGVAPGDYRVRAKDLGVASAPVDVTVKPSEETRLGPPLVLGQALPLEVTVLPHSAPGGGPWTVTVMRAEGLRQRAFLSESTAADGSVRLEVSAGDYFATVRADGQQWFGDFIHVSPDSGALQIELPLVPIDGHVRLGGKPLAALVVLRHPQGRAEVTFETDASGAFQGQLPGPGKWDAEVQYGDPAFVRTVRGLDIVPSPVSGEAEVTVNLPATWLRGEVATEEGTPVPGALVRIQSLAHELEPTGDGTKDYEPMSEATTDHDGRFEVYGLQVGPLVLSAESRDRSSDDVRIALVDGAEAATEVRLIARRIARLSGHLMGEEMRPLSGAMVWASSSDPEWRWRRVAGGRSQTDTEGRFELTLPAGTRRASLVAGVPGYALRLVPVGLPVPPRLVVPLARPSGRLVIESEKPWAPGHPHLAIGHGGAQELLIALVGFWAGPSGAVWDPRRIALPAMEPGDYEVCETAISTGAPSPPAKRQCTSGVLLAGGELILKVPQRR